MSVTSASKRATMEQLEELHYLLAKYLLECFRTAQPGDLKASLINVARAFLVDNGINAESIRDASDGAEALASMMEGMPDFSTIDRSPAN